MTSVTARFLSVCGCLSIIASAAFAAGEYQHTRDDKTIVWNAAPKPGDAASWFGDRDSDGYATGMGTLTWYTHDGEIYGRFFGNMVRGKFDGPVNVHVQGKTAHAMFQDGKRTTRWTAGRASSRIPERAVVKAEKPSAPERAVVKTE